MKTVFAMLALAVGLVSAQGPPACASPCLSSAYSAIGCAETDYSCICASTTELQQAAVTCLVTACDQAQLSSLESEGMSACNAFSASATGTMASVSATTTPASASGTPSTTPTMTSSESPSSASVAATSTSSGAAGYVELTGVGAVIAAVAGAVALL